MLNVDIVSQFDPAVTQELVTLVEDCEACTTRINQMMDRAKECLQSGTSQCEDEPTEAIEMSA